MAILGKFTATVVVDGKPCREYPDEEVDAKGSKDDNCALSVSKYIEVVPGAHFAIHIKPEKNTMFKKGNAVAHRISIDGKEVSRPLVRSEGQLRDGTFREVDGQRIGDGKSIRPFKFSSINFSELLRAATGGRC